MRWPAALPAWITAIGRVTLWLAALALTVSPGPRADEPDPAVFSDPLRFRALVNPDCSHCIDEAKRRAGDLRDDDRVLAWIRGKYDGGAVPYRFFLAPYRVISDTYGVFVYDPEAGFARGFEPSLEFTFYGWRNGVLSIAHADGTLFSGLTGRAFAGPRKGESLKPVPTLVTTWGAWRRDYPDTVAYRMFDKYQPIELPVEDDPDSVKTRPPADDRLPAKEEVVGLELGGAARAYTVAAIERAGGVLHDELSGQEVVVLWNAATRTAAVYSPQIEGVEPAENVTLSVDAAGGQGSPFVDAQTGSRWDIAGRSTAGRHRGRVLPWLPAVQCYWFAWSAEYPETSLFDGPPAAKRPPGAGIMPGPTSLAVLVEPGEATAVQVGRWRDAGYTSLVARLDESTPAEDLRSAAAEAERAGLALYFWIEVARNPGLADAHPRWMASLGSHRDWLDTFPGLRPPADNEVAKAWPWVPIGYRDAFDAHVERVRRLLADAPERYQGVLLNDLQGGPASCGCGNLQCRWALDYHVAATADVRPGNNAAGDFLEAVRPFVGNRELVPIWTTECETADLPATVAPGGRTTCLCGSVPCARGLCPEEFSKQWLALCRRHAGPIGLLLTHREFGRADPPYTSPVAWIRDGVGYVDSASEQHGGDPVDHRRLWLIVQGYDLSAGEQADAVRAAKELGPTMVVVAQARIDATYEPRMVTAAP
jgi:hypothetical protein